MTTTGPERAPEMKTIAVVNHKGGVAKTTTTVNLAAALSERNRRVLVVDLDPQASASVWLGVRSTGQPLLESILTGKGFDELVQETESCLDLIPAGAAVASLEKLGVARKGSEQLLKIALDQLPLKWDYVFLDCPPSLNLTTVGALVAASHALVPVVAQVLSLDPLARLLNTMWQIRGRFNAKLQLNGMFASRVTRTAHAEEVVKMLRAQFGEMVYKVVIRENTQLAECPGFQKPITQHDPRSHGAEDYRALAREFETRIKRKSGWKESKPRARETT